MFLHGLRKHVKPIARIAVTPTQMREPPVEPKLRRWLRLKKATNMISRCSLTLGRYNDNQSWWFPSCNSCSKACLRKSCGYRCRCDQCTSCKFKYKTCYFASDGTSEVELPSSIRDVIYLGKK